MRRAGADGDVDFGADVDAETGSGDALLRSQVLVAYVASQLDAVSVCQLAASHPVLYRLLTRGPLARGLWRQLSTARWSATPLPCVRQRGDATAVAAGKGPQVENWRVYYVAQASLECEAELECVDATRRLECDIHSFRRKRHTHSPGVIGLLGNLVAFEDPRVSLVMGIAVKGAVRSLIVDSVATIESFRRHANNYSVAFMPLQHTGHWTEALPQLPTTDGTNKPEGWVGWAHELAIVHPVLEEHRPMLRHFFRDRAVFATRRHAEAWQASDRCVDAAGGRAKVVWLDPLPEVRPEPTRAKLGFASPSLRTTLLMHPSRRDADLHAARTRCMSSMRAICTADWARRREATDSSAERDGGSRSRSPVTARGGAGGAAVAAGAAWPAATPVEMTQVRMAVIS